MNLILEGVLMKLAIMQPYFFPYIGYISLIKNTDMFIFFDTVQFIRHGWIERNRILKPNEGWQYISVPIKKEGSKTIIKDLEIKNDIDWKNKIFRQLEHYKKRAPFYKQTINVIEKGLDIQTDSIVKLNVSAIEAVCEYLGINFQYKIFSEMNLGIAPVQSPDEWALNICKALGIKEYWNPAGGLEFFSREKYNKENIKLLFLKPNLSFYSQRRGPENFEPGLSIIDVMMFNSKEEILNMLEDYELV